MKWNCLQPVTTVGFVLERTAGNQNIFVGNIPKNSRLDFRTVSYFIYCWCKEYTTIKFCQDELYESM